MTTLYQEPKMEREGRSSISPSVPKKVKLKDPLDDQQVEDQPKEGSSSPASKDPKARGLTSDAHISKDEILASQLAQQPVNIWYGKGRSGHQENGQDDEPDTSYGVNYTEGKRPPETQREAVNRDKEKSAKDTLLKKGIRCRGSGGGINVETRGSGDDCSSSSDAEDGGSYDYAASPPVIAAPQLLFGGLPPPAPAIPTLPVVPPVMAAPPPWSSAPLLWGLPPPAPTIPTGKCTTIAILDSGINIEHAAFQVGYGSQLKISAHSKCFVGDPEDVADRLGHGTQCAGLVCGSPDIIQLHNNANETAPFSSIAPDARVMVCKVVRDETEIADIQAVCSAIDHVISYNQTCEAIYDKVNVLSLSFGMEGFDSDLTKKIQEAVYEDIIVVCAASNNGRRGRQPITYPARLGHVLCIGACTANGKPTDFSPVGRELDFLANGEGVWVPTVGGSSNYCVVNGTSFAAPLVAGLVCQLIEDLRRLSEHCVGEEPALWRRVHNVWCVRELLKEMAAVQGKHSEESGFGALDPMEYFQKDDKEKLRIIQKILKH